jgi:hypothetical protein
MNKLYAYGAAVLVIILAFGGMYLKGRGDGKAVIRAEVAAQVALATAETARIETERDQISRRVESELLPRLKDATDRANSLAGRLRQYARSRPMPPDAGAAPGAPTAPGEPPDSGAVEQAIASHLGACARDSTRLGGWQDWYRAAQAIGGQP